jgi:hypothetical protein
MHMESLGTRLRAERERQNVSLEAIAEDTKIKISLLEGLEQDDLSCWPGGLFRRAYVRSYARKIGLEPEGVLREFLERYPEPVEPEPEETPLQARVLLSSPMAAMSSLLRRSTRNGTARVATPAPPLEQALAYGSPAPERPRPPIEAPAKSDATAPEEPVEHGIEDATGDPQRVPVALTMATASRREPSVTALADLCTRIGRLADGRGLRGVLGEAARVLDAVGLVLWSWDGDRRVLMATAAGGYSESVVAQLPELSAEDQNAVALAFHSGQPSLVAGGCGLTGAVAVPVLAPAGCVGVLAIEVHEGCDALDEVRAFALILAAQLVHFAGSPALIEAVA